MFTFSNLPALAVAGGLAVLSLHSLPGGADEPVEHRGPVGPHEAALTTVGKTRLIAFYEPDGIKCGLNVVMWESADDSGNAPTRVRVSLMARQTVNIDSVDNKSVKLECGDLADSLSITDGKLVTAGVAQ